MRIAILDDVCWIVNTMKKMTEEKGHTVLGIAVRISPEVENFNDGGKLDLYSRSLMEIVAAIQTFQPDFVFLDHNLQCDFTGEDVAAALGFDAGKLVGMSDSYQEYCDGGRFSRKLRFDLDVSKREFLRIIEVLRQRHDGVE